MDEIFKFRFNGDKEKNTCLSLSGTIYEILSEKQLEFQKNLTLSFVHLIVPHVLFKDWCG